MPRSRDSDRRPSIPKQDFYIQRRKYLDAASMEPKIAKAFRCLYLLTNYSNAELGGVAWPSIETLATRLSCSYRTVQSHIQLLEREGWIVISSGKGRRVTSRYEFVWERGEGEIAKLDGEHRRVEKNAPIHSEKQEKSCTENQKTLAPSGIENRKNFAKNTQEFSEDSSEESRNNHITVDSEPNFDVSERPKGHTGHDRPFVRKRKPNEDPKQFEIGYRKAIVAKRQEAEQAIINRFPDPIVGCECLMELGEEIYDRLVDQELRGTSVMPEDVIGALERLRAVRHKAELSEAAE